MSKPPLAGVRVTDFCWAWAGPYGTLQLAHLGAEVIRIESTTRPCASRLIPPWPGGKPGGFNRSGYFNQYNQGKRSLTLNFKKPEAIALAKKLIAKSDIVMENFASGVMNKMGFGYETLRQIKPDIIMISLSGYGASGPEKDYVSYGPPQVALGGMSSLTGYQDWPPMQAGFSYGDPNGGVHGAFAVLCALLRRAKTGEGQYIDLSQWEAGIMLIPEGVMEYTMNGTQPARNGSRDLYMAPHGVFRCRGEDRWVSIAVGSDEEWQKMCAAIGKTELARDPRFATLAARKKNEDELEAIVTAWTQERSADEVTTCLQNAGVAAYPALDSKDMNRHPHVEARGFFVELEHAEVGKMRHMGIPWKMSRTPCQVQRPAPCMGQDTDYVMGDVLGLSSAEIASLKAQEILI
ncbi:MAG: CaiB/BaiF CoA transferase family protein [Candidatus Binatia bacterium]